MSDQTPDPQIGQQANEQTGQRSVRLRMDERNRTSAYANAFRTSATAEEVIIDLGLNQAVPLQQTPGREGNGQPSAEILFEISHRMILNYYTAKRLALTLGQLVHHHEQQFGELKLNAADRAKNAGRSL